MAEGDDDATVWQGKAQEAYRLALQLADHNGYLAMLKIAETYQHMADLAEKRSRSAMITTPAPKPS